MNVRQVRSHGPISLELDDIAENPGPYTMSYGFDLKPLIRSIEQFGLIYPPYIVNSRVGDLIIVMGYRRIKALKSLGWKKAPFLDLSNSGLSSLQLLLLNLYDNLSTRSFNPIEKGMILKRLTSFLSRHEVYTQYAPLLDISSSKEMDLFLQLDDAFTSEIKEAIAFERISLSTAALLLEMDVQSRAVVFQCLSELNFNMNQQRQFIEYINDISIQDKKTINELIARGPIPKVMENRQLNNPQKIKTIISILRAKRFSRLHQIETAFKKAVTGINLPDQVRIDHPPYFEASNYRIEILFKDGQELKKIIGQLGLNKKLDELPDLCNQNL
jgi:hypothetical protein